MPEEVIDRYLAEGEAGLLKAAPARAARAGLDRCRSGRPGPNRLPGPGAVTGCRASVRWTRPPAMRSRPRRPPPSATNATTRRAGPHGRQGSRPDPRRRRLARPLPRRGVDHPQPQHPGRVRLRPLPHGPTPRSCPTRRAPPPRPSWTARSPTSPAAASPHPHRAADDRHCRAKRWSLRRVRATHGIKRTFIESHCPWQNGKVVERLNHTVQTEWASRQVFNSNAESAAALGPWPGLPLLDAATVRSAGHPRSADRDTCGLRQCVALGTLTRQAARFLEAAVVSGLNILVAGGTQAGKPATPQYAPQGSSAFFGGLGLRSSSC